MKNDAITRLLTPRMAKVAVAALDELVETEEGLEAYRISHEELVEARDVMLCVADHVKQIGRSVSPAPSGDTID